MSRSKKILVILSRVPYPLEKGDKLRAYHQIKELHKTHQISLCCLSDQKVTEEARKALEKITDELHIFYLKKWLIYWNAFRMIFTDKPVQVGYFFQSGIKRQIRQKIGQFKPDAIYCQLIRVSEYVKDIHNIPKTLDYMDAFSKGMLRRAEIERGWKKMFYRMEGERLKVYENKIFDYFNNHTIISEQDRRLIGHTNNQQIEVIENGIDDSFFNFDALVPQTYDIVFVGNLNYAPNIASCEFIIDQLYPKLVAKNPGITILLAGANPHDKIVSKVNNHRHIHLSGWVEDIRYSYRSGKVFVAPLFIGTGLQNKLLEAMALGLPSVTTDLVNNALGAESGKQVLTANSADGFAEAIDALLKQDELYETLSVNAKAFVQRQFSWVDSTARIPF